MEVEKWKKKEKRKLSVKASTEVENWKKKNKVV